MTVSVTEHVPTFVPTIFVPETLQSFSDDEATEASTDSPLPVDNPAAAAEFTSVIAAPRFIAGEPTTFIDIDAVVELPFFGVSLTFTTHLPGATPLIFEPAVLHTELELLETEPATDVPFGTEIFDAVTSFDSKDVVPVLMEAVFVMAAGTVVV